MTKSFCAEKAASRYLEAQFVTEKQVFEQVLVVSLVISASGKKTCNFAERFQHGLRIWFAGALRPQCPSKLATQEAVDCSATQCIEFECAVNKRINYRWPWGCGKLSSVKHSAPTVKDNIRFLLSGAYAFMPEYLIDSERAFQKCQTCIQVTCNSSFESRIILLWPDTWRKFYTSRYYI